MEKKKHHETTEELANETKTTKMYFPNQTKAGKLLKGCGFCAENSTCTIVHPILQYVLNLNCFPVAVRNFLFSFRWSSEYFKEFSHIN